MSVTINSLDFNPALKVFSYTLSSISSTSKVSLVKRFTYEQVVYQPFRVLFTEEMT